MPSKKKKYNARFPAGRIKKIMQSDEEVGKVAQAVPVIISRTLEMFVCSLLQKAMQVTSAKNAKTLTPTHMKQCILSEQRFDFLKDLVKTVQDSANGDDDMSGAASSQMVSGTNRALRQRRKSSTKEETVIKKVGSIKEEPIEECCEMSANCSTAVNPNLYLESESDETKPCTSLKTEKITEPQPNCSNIPFNPNFYSESVLEQQRTDPLIKTEPITEPQPNCSNIHFNPNFYSESVLEQQRTDPLIKTEPITDPLANCTPVHFSPNFYSQPVSDQGRTDPVIKIEPKMEPMANCSTIRFSPNFYSEPLSEQKRAGVITEPSTNCSIPHIIPRFYPVSKQIQAYPVSRTESPTNRSNLRFCPNFYSETAAEQSRTAGPVIKTEPSHAEVMDHPQVMANCSTLHFGPSTHSLPVCPPSSVPCQQPARIASLTMDEDYDT